MLSDFFRINLPYGIGKNENGEWMAFNREYMPLGFNKSVMKMNINKTTDYPVHTEYSNITEKALLKLVADDDGAIRRDAAGDICTVFFYNDRTNPVHDPTCWDRYFDIIKTVSAFKID